MPRAYSSIFALMSWSSPGRNDEIWGEERERGPQLHRRRPELAGSLSRLLRDVAEVFERLRREQPARVRAQLARGLGAARARRARRQRDLAVVVEHDEQARVEVVGAVHRLVRHAARDRAVANHRDAVVARLAQELLADAHALRGRDRRRRVARAERVVPLRRERRARARARVSGFVPEREASARAPRSASLALRLLALLEAREPVLLPQRRHARAAAREDLVRVALVAHVPEDPVVGRLLSSRGRRGAASRGERARSIASDISTREPSRARALALWRVPRRSRSQNRARARALSRAWKT